MKKFYTSALFLIALFCTQKITAQVACHASFSLDTTVSGNFIGVLVNISSTTPALTPPDSLICFWSWGDGTSSTGMFPTHTYTSPGSKYIYLSITASNKACSDSVMRTIIIDSLGGFHKTNAGYTIKVVAPAKSGININNNNQNMVSITPTIVSNFATLSFKGIDKNAGVQVEIFSADGKNVVTINEQLNGTSLHLPTASLPSGMYFATIKADNKTAYIKFVKQ